MSTLPTDELDPKAEKAREARLRTAARKRGLRLERAHTRTVYHYEFGTYQLVDIDSGRVVASSLSLGFGLSLDDVSSELAALSTRVEGAAL